MPVKFTTRCLLILIICSRLLTKMLILNFVSTVEGLDLQLKFDKGLLGNLVAELS
jgi:hypothetical protein